MFEVYLNVKDELTFAVSLDFSHVLESSKTHFDTPRQPWIGLLPFGTALRCSENIL